MTRVCWRAGSERQTPDRRGRGSRRQYHRRAGVAQHRVEALGVPGNSGANRHCDVAALIAAKKPTM